MDQAVNYKGEYVEGDDLGSPTRATAGTAHDTGSDTDFKDKPAGDGDGEDDEFDEEPNPKDILPDELEGGNGTAGVPSLAAQPPPGLEAAATPAASAAASTTELLRATVSEKTC